MTKITNSDIRNLSNLISLYITDVNHVEYNDILISTSSQQMPDKTCIIFDNTHDAQ